VAGLIAGTPTILYGGLLSVGIAYTLQVIAQRHTHASDAAILLSSETLFAALAGVLYLGERLNSLQMTGAVLIFSSILLVQLVPLGRPAPSA
jgi:drug/metabolite transporter (DMT)-like permease